MTDTLFADRYRFQRELGRGSFGIVNLAHDTRLRDRAVALKRLHPALSNEPGVLRRFEDEAGALASLRHDHIVTIYDTGLWHDQRFLVMEYIAGPSLKEILSAQGAQPPETVIAWLRQAADALAYAHAQNLLHRDLKPANLLLETARNRLFVVDFGLARAVEVSGGSSSDGSLQMLTGTAAYRAPEVRKTGHTIASDLYGLGVVAYELLAGKLPFEATDPLDLMMAHLTEPVPPLPDAVPGSLAEIVMHLLAKEPSARPAGADDVLTALRRPPAPMPASTSSPSSTPVAVTPPVIRQDPRLAELARRADEAERELEAERAAAAQRAAAAEAKRRADEEAAALQRRIEEMEHERARLRAEAEKPTQPMWQQIGIEMVRIPAGDFLYGDDKVKRRTDEFRIAKTPVTNAQYQVFVRATNAHVPDHWTDNRIPKGKEQHPVVNVSWEDAQAFCRWVGVRLPGELEWEKAARGTDGRDYPWGNAAPDETRCNFNNIVRDTTAVGSYPAGASPYGVLDMAGNVWEWCQDAHEAGSNYRVLRGGAFNDNAYGVRCAYRGRYDVNVRGNYVGFRVVAPSC